MATGKVFIATPVVLFTVGLVVCSLKVLKYFSIIVKVDKGSVQWRE